MAASSLPHQRQQRRLCALLLMAMALCLALSLPTAGAFVVPCPRQHQQPFSIGSASRVAVSRRQLPTISGAVMTTTTATRRWAARGQQGEEEQEQVQEQEGWLVKLGYKAGEEDKTRSLKERLKSAGVAGVFAYVASEVLFWFISLPAGILFYHQTTGEWLDLSTPEGKAKVAGFSAGFLAFARVALPVRAAVALAITPPLSKYVIQPLIDRGVLQEREPAEE